MRTKMLLFYLLAALLGGCLPVLSIRPLYTEKEVIFKQELIGVWAHPIESEGTWEFKRDPESENAYKLIVAIPDDAKGLFDAHLVKLKDQLFLDVFPAKEAFEQTMESLGEAAKDPNNKVWALSLVFCTVPVHTFIKVDLAKSELSLRLTDDELLRDVLEQDPNAVEHVYVDADKGYLLTAPTKELQAFVLKYADGDKLFGEPTLLKRRKARASKRRGRDSGGR